MERRREKYCVKGGEEVRERNGERKNQMRLDLVFLSGFGNGGVLKSKVKRAEKYYMTRVFLTYIYRKT
jgi:hypothetical protein